MNIPDEPTLREMEDTSIRLARGAGEVLLHYQPGGTQVNFKGKGQTDPVTEADLRVEEYLRERISREFPGHRILAEESDQPSGTEDTDFIWALDPVDGTANFAAGVPFFAVSIGLLYRGAPVVGSLFLPHTFAGHGVFHARAGGGAFAEDQPLRVISDALPRPSGLAGVPSSLGRQFSIKREKGRGLGEIRIMGSIACEMALVAKGVLQYAMFGGPSIWDAAAGVALIREAGGEVLEWREGRWQPFERFLVSPEGSGGDHRNARQGRRAPLLAGGRDIVAYVASRTRRRSRPLESIRNRLRGRRS